MRWIFAALALAFTIAVESPAQEKATGNKLAHIKLSGNLDEAPVANDPLFGLGAENFKSKIDRIQKATQDKNVQALLVQVDGVGISWAKIEELRQAIQAFRKTGRKAYAFMDSGDSKDFLVAAGADIVCMPESGWLMIVGMQAEVTFYKSLLEKLGIRADFLQMGVYKFAAEPLTRTTMSEGARAQLKLVLDDFFNNSLVKGIVDTRGRTKKNLTAEKVAKMIDEGPFSARKAAELGLIDHVVYLDEFEKLIIRDHPDRKLTLVRDYGSVKPDDIDFSNPFAIFKLLAASSKAAPKGNKDRVAIIYASGAITTGKSAQSFFDGASTVGSTTMIQAIRQADSDPKVKAIVLRVDSPGGSALASDLIWNELKRCKKPVVASMSDVAASGGYYISMPAKKIFAQPGTLTGSIGVVGGKLALSGLYDKIGIDTEIIRHGANAGILSSTHVFSPSERKAMEALMTETYDQFLSKAVAGRNEAGQKFTKKEMLKYAEGRIWTGRQAKEIGLIDELGGLDDAIAAAKVLGGLEKDADTDFLILPKPRSFFDALLEKSSEAQANATIGRLLQIDGLRQHAARLEGMLQLRNDPVWLMLPHAVEIK